MKKFIKAAVFLLLVAILLEVTVFLLAPNKTNYLKYGPYNMGNFDILDEKEDTVDVIFLGDSLVYSSISPMVIWHEYGITSFDCADPGQPIPLSYKYLKAAIKSQHPKVVMMEADVIFRKYKSYRSRRMMLMTYTSILPVEKYHNNWKKLFSTESNKTKWINVAKGYKYITKKKGMKQDNDNMEETEKLFDIPNGALDYLDKIIKLCDENNIKFILVSNPSKVSWNYSKTLTVSAIAKDRKIDFLDLNNGNPTNIDWKNETKDKGIHINYKGAKKVSKYIGNYLNNLKILEDHRKDEKYKEWNLAYDKYVKTHAKYETTETE